MPRVPALSKHVARMGGGHAAPVLPRDPTRPGNLGPRTLILSIPIASGRCRRRWGEAGTGGPPPRAPPCVPEAISLSPMTLNLKDHNGHRAQSPEALGVFRRAHHATPVMHRHGAF